MQLVVMAAVLALAGAGAGQGCCFECGLTYVNLTVESCGRTGSILTTICLNHVCFENPPLDVQTYEQETCLGVWVYEVKHIDGCPEGVTYPVAKNCTCGVCDPNKNTDCTRLNVPLTPKIQ
uniref:Glycoprotein hormone subunit beta domain-containing protein n=1 Tax=Cyclopterus lumpus TaxID=8103 RepID=A0A8C2WCD5_CYCLU